MFLSYVRACALTTHALHIVRLLPWKQGTALPASEVLDYMNEVKRFLTAVQFFTRLPIPFAAWVGFSPEQLNASSRYFPLVGWLIGCLVCAFVLLLNKLLPITVTLLLAFAFSALLTGAFHEDGFTDAVDGLGGAYDRDRALTIMRDSRIGSFGALALVLLIAIKWQALVAIGQQSMTLMLYALLLAQPVSRWLACVLMKCLPYAHERLTDTNSETTKTNVSSALKAKPIAESMSHISFLIATVLGFVAPLALSIHAPTALPYPLMPVAIVCGLALACLCTLYWGWRLARRLGGITGDALGACQQMSEAALYLGVLGYAAR
jgi:adenosylcobinamide-GDP ribazoletransferase